MEDDRRRRCARASRAATASARRRRRAAGRRRAHPEALSALHVRELRRLQRAAGQGAAVLRAAGGALPGRREGRCCCKGSPGVGKTHLAVATLLQMIRTRGARGLFYDTRDLLRVIRVHLRSGESDGRDGRARPGDARRRAGARRSRRREDVRVGRGDDEPHRQHALQREARRPSSPPTTTTTRTSTDPDSLLVPHRLSDAVAAARDVRVPRI